jgi:hypothetical protein
MTDEGLKKYCLEMIRNLSSYYDYKDAHEDILGSGNADDIFEYGSTLGMIEALKRVLEMLSTSE